MNEVTLEDEWLRDVGGDRAATEMTFGQFFNAVFELLDQVCCFAKPHARCECTLSIFSVGLSLALY